MCYWAPRTLSALGFQYPYSSYPQARHLPSLTQCHAPSSLWHFLTQIPLTGMLVFPGVPSPPGSLTATPAQPFRDPAPEQPQCFLTTLTARPVLYTSSQLSSAAQSSPFPGPGHGLQGRSWASILLCAPRSLGTCSQISRNLEKKPGSSWLGSQSLFYHF